ncbi:MlaD family protein [Aquifex aeolicus]|nr:MlaD family protein [Aquifex aeolicus]
MRLTTELKLGAFVVAVSLAFAFLVLTFGEIPFFQPKMKEYLVYFDEVAGLSKGAEVRVSGVRAGKVKEIILERGKVKVVFEVKEEIPIYRDAIASIGTLGLMGDKYLAVKPGSPESGELPPRSEIKNVKTVSDTDKLIASLTQTAEEFKKVAQNLNTILLENRENLRQTIAHLNYLIKNLNEITEQNRGKHKLSSEEFKTIDRIFKQGSARSPRYFE